MWKLWFNVLPAAATTVNTSYEKVGDLINIQGAIITLCSSNVNRGLFQSDEHKQDTKTCQERLSHCKILS